MRSVVFLKKSGGSRGRSPPAGGGWGGGRSPPHFRFRGSYKNTPLNPLQQLFLSPLYLSLPSSLPSSFEKAGSLRGFSNPP